MSVRVEKAAPDFTVKAYHAGGYRDASLSDYRGRWVVLFFYPGDYTFVCPTELVDMAKRQRELREMDVEVLAISTDSHHVHRAWQEAELSRMVDGGLPFPMLSDAGGRVGQAYGVYAEEDGVDIRGTFIVDPDGTLRSAEINAPALGRSADELLRKLSALRHARATGEVMPACWTPGQKTLTAGPELVGRVWEVWQR
jgi:peroxiredoxin (alkyl hydroperoxide reductase subunit C)